jgi:hypothetical protein
MPLIEALRAHDIDAVARFHRALNGPVAEDLVRLIDMLNADGTRQPLSSPTGPISTEA